MRRFPLPITLLVLVASCGNSSSPMDSGGGGGDDGGGMSPMVPGAPTALAATPSDGQVALSWQAPASDGGSAVTGYDVYRGAASGALGAKTKIQSGVAATSFMNLTAAKGTLYYYQVTAINAAGESPGSNEVSSGWGLPSLATLAGALGGPGWTDGTGAAARFNLPESSPTTTPAARSPGSGRSPSPRPR